MRRDWDPEELIASWTLVDHDWELVGNKTGATRLGFALLLKFFELEARFPRHAGELPKAAVAYLAEQRPAGTRVEPHRFAEDDWSSRSSKLHCAQVRAALGFREAMVEDEDHLAAWLAVEVCPVERSDDRLREALLARCRAERLEPPAGSRIERLLDNARASFERQFTATIAGRLSAAAVGRLERLLGDEGVETALGQGASFLIELKADPGQLGLETLLKEISKLERVRAIGLPADLFAGWSDKLVAAWRARAATLYPSDFRSAPPPIRRTFLAALCVVRIAELTDGLAGTLGCC